MVAALMMVLSPHRASTLLLYRWQGRRPVTVCEVRRVERWSAPWWYTRKLEMDEVFFTDQLTV